ncbi:MAG TPA: AraC family transcriptional regulator [Vicinamibacterales bacterium]|nr:AraC family transcriptional regulator [Vicinamibacterales bacterium]
MTRPPIDLEPRVYTPHRIAAVVATLVEDGIAVEQALAGSQLEPAHLDVAETRVSYRQIAAVFGNAARLARDPTLAFRAGAHMHLTAYGMYGYALLSSPSLAAAVDFAVKYNRAMGPVADISIVREGGVEIYRHDVLLSPDPGDALYRFTLEFAYAANMTVCRDLYGESFGYEVVRVVYAAPVHAHAYGALFRCPVHFGQPANELQLDAASARRAPRMPDAHTYGMASRLCEQFLTELAESSGLASVVRRTLVEQMPWRLPSIESMADELAMHPRTLRRRLDAEGTSYRELLVEVRLRLAIEYLRKTRMTNEDIAERLGYSDAANFRHAFTRWTGRSPHEYRRV